MKVGILTPCYQGTVHHFHMMAAIKTFEMAREKGIELRQYTAAGCPVLPRVRNRLLADAMADGCDWAVFIDDDIVWKPEDLFKMLEHGVDVIAAAPPKRHKRWDEKPTCAVRFPRDGQIEGRLTKAGRIWKVDGLATAFMAIKLTVLKSIEDVTEAFVYDGCARRAGEVMRNWFWYDIIDAGDGLKTDEGEDYYFCSRVIEKGGSVWVDPDIRLSHYDGNVCHDHALCDDEVAREQAA